MKILLHYLKPYKWLVTLVLSLAAVNIGFSLVDPILLGKLINLAAARVNDPLAIDENRFFNSFSWNQPGVWFIVACSITVAMISRIAKKLPGLFFECGDTKIRGQSFYRWFAACHETTVPAI